MRFQNITPTDPCTQKEYQHPGDLEKVLARWPNLSAEIRAAILAIVDASE